MATPQRAVLEEIDSRWVQDAFLKVLASRCSLTKRQLEALLIEATAEEMGRRLSFAEKASMMGVRKGSYARILSQALNNISQSLFTVLLLSYLDMLGEKKHRWFLEIGEAIRDGRIDEALMMLEEMQDSLKRRFKLDR